MCAIVLICALAGAYLAPHDPSQQDLTAGLVGPTAHHWLGTDSLGRDIFSRLIAGSRSALLGPVLIVLGALLAGNVLGVVSGYYAGRVDWVIMRGVDIMYALPALLIAIVVVGTLGGGYFRAVGLLIILTIPYDTRVIRGATLEQRGLPYIESAKALGLSSRRIMFRNLWPNLVPIVIANSFLNLSFSLVTLAGLSFLGLGVGPGTADWGRMLAENEPLLVGNPLAVIAPALMIVLVAASMNLIGDWLAERVARRGRGE